MSIDEIDKDNGGVLCILYSYRGIVKLKKETEALSPIPYILIVFTIMFSRSLYALDIRLIRSYEVS